MRTKLVKVVLLSLGFLSLTLGVVGIFLPLLPTTPFLLLSAWLFFHSSSRVYQWLMNNRVVGGYIRSFREQKAIPMHAKIISVTLLWISILYSITCIVPSVWLKIVLGLVAIGVSWHILAYRTLRRDKKTEELEVTFVEKSVVMPKSNGTLS